MSENLDLVRSIYAAWEPGGNLDAALEFLAPDIELHLTGAFPDLAPVYRGHEGVEAFSTTFIAPWRELTVEIDRIVDLGEQVLTLSHFHGQGRDGIDVRMPMAHLWALRSGRV